MLRILTYEEIDCEAWSALVRESRTGTWFQGPEAYALFASMPELFRPFAIGIYRENINTDKHADGAINIDKEEATKNAHSTSAMPDGLRGLERNQPQTPTSELAASVDANTPNLLPDSSTLNAYENATSSSENGKNGELRGVCVGYVTVEKSAYKQFFTRRAIILGGPALADDCDNEEVESLMRAVHAQLKSQAIYVETRNFNDYSKWKDAFSAAGFSYQPHLNFHIDTTSIEVIDSNLGKSRKRDIRTSFREGAFIIDTPTIEQVREYYAILAELYRTKIKLPLFPLSFFEALYHHPDGRFLLVGMPKENGGVEIIGGTACVAWKPTLNPSLEGRTFDNPSLQGGAGGRPVGTVYEWFACGEDGVYPHVFPSSLATYAGIKYAAEHGCERFDMMGAGKPNESYGVRDFKAKFGGQEVEHGRFIAINNEWLYRIGAFGVSVMQRESWLPSAEQKPKENIPGKKEWSQFVAHHPQGTIFQTPEMYAVYEQTRHQKPIVVSVKREGKIAGLLLAVIQWNGGALAKPLTARSIIIGGPLVEKYDQNVLRELMEEYQRRLPGCVVYSEIRPVYEFKLWEEKNIKNTADAAINIEKEEVTKNAESTVASSNLRSLDSQSAREQSPGQTTAQSCDADIAELSLHDSLQKNVNCINSQKNVSLSKNYLKGWKRVGHYNLVLRVDKSGEELWNGMHKERRRNVGQAEKAGLRFEEVRTEEGRKAVIALLQKTYARKHVPMADSSLFERLTELMPKNVHFFAAYHGDKMIAGQIRLGYKDLLYAWYAGSDEQYFKLRPNDFLMWNVIKWAHTQGYKEFDFGGGGEPGKPYGVRDYKLKYGCEMKDYGRWICVKRPIIYGMAKQMYAILHKE